MPNVERTAPARARANGIELCYDTFGDADAPPLLLIMGLASQMIAWHDEFCASLAARGYRVIRFDNRDIGLSTSFDSAGVPNIGAAMAAALQGKPVDAPYRLSDMARRRVRSARRARHRQRPTSSAHPWAAQSRRPWRSSAPSACAR